MDNELDIQQIMNRMADELALDFIQREAVRGALDILSLAAIGVRDEKNPSCLLACAIGLHNNPVTGRQPVNCGLPSDANTHSVTESGPLCRIASHDKSGAKVLRLMPGTRQLADMTKGERGYPGSEWLWNVKRIEPQSVPTSLASVGHSICADHDREVFVPVDGLNFTIPERYLRRQIAGVGSGLYEALFLLGYRTLLYRLSQFRGLELEACNKRVEQVQSGQRFGVDLMDDVLRELSGIALGLYADKLIYDQCFVGLRRTGFVHHIAPLRPYIPFTASEYVEFKCSWPGKEHIDHTAWIAVNVIPAASTTWLVVSHIENTCPRFVIGVSNQVRDFCADTLDIKKRKHLNALQTWTNAYCSPEAYWALPDTDREAIEKGVARAVCQEPHRRFLQILKSTPRGAEMVARWSSTAN